MEYKYDAFISYRHKTDDQKTAIYLQKMLENYKVPRVIRQKSVKRKIFRVFRDQEELSVSSNLTEVIYEALKQAEFLIVVCSTDTPKSEWIRKEIETFIQYRGREYILTVLVDGEPQTSFPQELLYMSEPLAADFRNKSKKERRLEFLRLAAPILHCSIDELRQRHREQKMHYYMKVMIFVVCFLGAFGSYSYYQMLEIRNAYTESKKQESRYLVELSLQALEDGDRIKAVELALQALPDTQDKNRPVITQAEYALSQALYLYHQKGVMYTDLLADQMIEIQGRGVDFQISQSGNFFLMRDDDGRLYFWELEKGSQTSVFQSEGTEVWNDGYEEAYIIDDNQAVALARNNNLECLDIRNGNKIWEVKSDRYYEQLFLSQDGRYLGAVEEADGFFSNPKQFFYKIFNRSDGSEYKTVTVTDGDYMHIHKTQMNCNGSKIASLEYTETLPEEGTTMLVCDVQEEETVKVSIPVIGDIEMCWLDERYLAVVSKEKIYVGEANVTYRIGVYDTDYGKWRWNKTGEHILGGNLEIETQKGDDGKDIIILMSDPAALGFNCQTGELCMDVMGTGDALMSIMRTCDSGILFYTDGSLLIIGENSQYIHKDVLKPMTYMFKGNGVYVGINEDGRNIILYRILGDESYHNLLKIENSISEACCSKDGKLAAFMEYTHDEKNTVHIVDWRTMEVIRSFEVEEAYPRIKLLGFTQAGELLISHNGIKKFDVWSGTKSEKRLDGSSLKIVCTPDGSKILYIHSKNSDDDVFSVINTASMEVIQEQSTGSYIEKGVFSEDGKYITLVDQDGTLSFYRWSGSQYEKYVDRTGRDRDRKYYQVGIVGSENGNLLAFFCNKEIVQIWDMEQGMMKASIEFSGKLNKTAFFSPDNRYVFLQDNLGTFSCYDLKQNKWKMKSIDQLPPVKRCQWDKSGNHMAVYVQYPFSFQYMIIYQRQENDTWIRYAIFPYAQANSDDCKTVIVDGGNGDTQLGYFCMRALEEMLVEARGLLDKKGG